MQNNVNNRGDIELQPFLKAAPRPLRRDLPYALAGEIMRHFTDLGDCDALATAVYGKGLKSLPDLHPYVRHAAVWSRAYAQASAHMGPQPPPGRAEAAKVQLLAPCMGLGGVASSNIARAVVYYWVERSVNTICSDSFEALPPRIRGVSLGLAVCLTAAFYLTLTPGLGPYTQRLGPVIQQSLWAAAHGYGQASALVCQGQEEARWVPRDQRLATRWRIAYAHARALAVPLAAVAALGAGGYLFAQEALHTPLCGAPGWPLLRIFSILNATLVTSIIIGSLYRWARIPDQFTTVDACLKTAVQTGFHAQMLTLQATLVDQQIA